MIHHILQISFNRPSAQEERLVLAESPENYPVHEGTRRKLDRYAST